MHRFRVAATLLLAFSAGAPAAAAGGNLIVDGGFEQYRPVPSWISLSAGARNLPGWRVTSGAIDLVGGYFRAFEGKNSLEVGSPGASAVEQKFRRSVARTIGSRLSLREIPRGRRVSSDWP